MAPSVIHGLLLLAVHTRIPFPLLEIRSVSLKVSLLFTFVPSVTALGDTFRPARCTTNVTETSTVLSSVPGA